LLRPTHYLALQVATGELIASVPISQHLQFHRDALTHLLHDPAAYDDGILAVYSVALTDDPDDMPPPGFDSVYAGLGLPDGYAAAWNVNRRAKGTPYRRGKGTPVRPDASCGRLRLDESCG
jgi:hypothetical protein